MVKGTLPWRLDSSNYDTLHLMSLIDENNRKINSACCSFVPCLDCVALSQVPIYTAPFHMKKEQNLSVLDLCSYYSAVKTEPFENANENAKI